MEKCQIELPGGEICGKDEGRCIHSWQPTIFGGTEKENPAISDKPSGGALDNPMRVV